MTNQLIDELRALLFGEEPYARSRAPEPELFVELIPILPKSILDDMVISIGSLGLITKTQRALLFAALAELLPEPERRKLLWKWLEEYPELVAAHVPKNLLDEALAAAINIDSVSARVAALTALVVRLPDSRRRRCVLEKAIAAARKIDSLVKRVNALSKLASNLSEPEKVDLGKAALALARTLDSDKERGEALASVGRLLDEPLRSKVLKEALAATRNIYWEADRSQVLTELAPYLPEHLLGVALASAEELQNEHKVMLLVALVPHLPEPLLGTTLETVFATLRDIGLNEERIRKFVEMAQQLSEPLKGDVLEELLSMVEVISWEEDRACALMELAPHLSERLLREALALAQAIKENWWKASALSALYPFLANADRKSIADRVAAISGERLRQLLTQLPEEKRVALLGQAYDKFFDYYGGAAPPALAMPREELEEEPGPLVARRARVPELAKPPSPQERIVNTGFASKIQAHIPLDSALPLAPKRHYYFWFEVGPPVPRSIEVKPEPLMVEFLPSDARLKVALFAFEGEIEITPGGDVGEIQVMPDGKVRVVRQVERPHRIHPGSDLLKRRLFFPVRTPSKDGIFRLRCNIYYEQILVESRLIKVRVARESMRSVIPALQSTVEYTMSKALNPNYLIRMNPQKLSLMLNNNGDGTHCFRLFGAQDFKSDTCFNVRTLETLIEHARGALRQASWGDQEPWIEGKHYRYIEGYNQDRLKDDLIRFAVWGYRFWTRFTQKIAGGKRDVRKLAKMMSKPTTLEFAIKDKTEASDYMFPAAMIYDYPLDTNLDHEDYKLCSSFLSALEAGNPLEEASCFKGDCPSREDLTVICPGGFWGFRHSIGIPLGTASETNHEVMYQHNPELTVAVFPSFKEWPSHQQALSSLKPGMVWNFADTRLDTFAKLKSTNPHVVYFYCHGGIEKNTPYLKVGAKNEKGITPDNLLSYGIWWESPQPLVFINGCHTTALEPKQVLDFVASFVISSHAAGVVGTEITIFESLACAFAEECLRRFLVEGETIGQAVRKTRLKLLKQGNPLGLVYTIYANASLRLKKAGET